MSDRRFYLPYYADQRDRSPILEDIGSMLTVSGLVLQGMGSTLILLHPSAEDIHRDACPECAMPVGEPHDWLGCGYRGVVGGVSGTQPIFVARPSLEDWAEIIRLSDDPQAFVGEEGGLRKKLQRKQILAISGETQQRVWARDGFACVYCGAKMGKMLMSIDHFIPLELGGKNDESNYVTSCRRDNKAKGMMMPEEFCRKKGYDFERIQRILRAIAG